MIFVSLMLLITKMLYLLDTVELLYCIIKLMRRDVLSPDGSSLIAADKRL